MGEVVVAEFGRAPASIPGMPKGAPELLNRLAVLAHDRNKAIAVLDEAQRKADIAARVLETERDVLRSIDVKLRDTHRELISEIKCGMRPEDGL